MHAVTRVAPAKLNLYLHIEGRRADGYHRLESLVAFTQLGDSITVEPAHELSLEVMGEFADACGVPEHNLVRKAARALMAHSGQEYGARITLHKNIPVGAGLGGGSADAAAALLALNACWQLHYDMPMLQRIGQPLGADVPMCLLGTPAIARGIGDELSPLTQPLPLLFVLLVHPRVPLLTKAVYAAYDAKTAIPAPAWLADTGTDAMLDALRARRNHLQPAAIACEPLVAELLLALETLVPAPALVRMSGSGASCFALYHDEQAATLAHKALARDYPAWWHCVTALV